MSGSGSFLPKPNPSGSGTFLPPKPPPPPPPGITLPTGSGRTAPVAPLTPEMLQQQKALIAKNARDDLTVNKYEFLNHAPFTLTSFQPTTGGKFDARFDPGTRELKITLKIAFKWKDFTKTEGESPRVKKKFSIFKKKERRDYN